MKILHVTKKYEHALGGDVIVVSNLVRHQRSSGDETMILTSNCDDTAKAPNLVTFGFRESSHRLDVVSGRRLASLPSLASTAIRVLRSFRPDVVHSHSPELGFVVGWVARSLGIPVVHTCHGVAFTEQHMSSQKRFLERTLLRRAPFAAVTVLGPHLVSALERIGVARVVYIPNGVEPGDWDSSDACQTTGEFTYLAVGRVEPQKGFGYLIDAFEEVSRDRRARLVIAGDGSGLADLAKAIDDRGLSGHVVLAGRRTQGELRDLYRSADCFVVSSVWEGFPLTILESWAMGVPVVTTSVGSIGEICVNHGDAIVVDPRDAGSLARGMEAVADDPALREVLIAGGRERVAREFNWTLVSMRFRELYASVVGLPRR